MSLTLSAIVTAAIAVAVSQVGAVTVYTPASVVACQPVQLSWVDGQAPYYLSLLPGGQPNAAPLEDLGEQSGNSLVWKPTLPVGTEVTIQIRDSAGVINYSGLIKIQQGTEDSCDATSSDDDQTPDANATPHDNGAHPVNKPPGVPLPTKGAAAGDHAGILGNNTTSSNATGLNSTGLANSTAALGGLNSTGMINSTSTLGGLSSSGKLGGFNSTSTGITSPASTFTTPMTSNTKSFNDGSDDEDLDSGASRTSVSVMAVLVAGAVTFFL
ncbi:secreted protein [Melampsora americana]|nr:secreted protein [Melampsora americana]